VYTLYYISSRQHLPPVPCRPSSSCRLKSLAAAAAAVVFVAPTCLTTPFASAPLQAFQELQAEAPELLLLGAVRAAVGPDDLAAVAAAEPAIRQQWEAAGLLAPAQILAAVQGLGYEVERKVVVAAAAGAQSQQQQQQQQQQEEEEEEELCAVVDVCLKLPDGRRVAVLVSGR
jgi:hypothetical protein